MARLGTLGFAPFALLAVLVAAAVAIATAAALPTAAQALITQRGSAVTSASPVGTNVTTLVVGRPTGVIEGDVMIATIVKRGNSTANPTLAGWTPIDGRSIGGNGGNTRRAIVLYKVATATEPASYAFALNSSSSGAVGSIVAFKGNLTGAAPLPFDTTPLTISTGTTVGVNATAISTASNNAAVLMLGMAAGAVGGSTWSGWTAASPAALSELYDAQQDGNASVGGAWAIKPAPGSTGGGRATLPAAQNNGGLLLALAPDLNAPSTASVTSPVGGSVYRTATMPTAVIGTAVDTANGSGLDPDSTTFTLQRLSDDRYWDGIGGWQIAAVNLPTTHAYTTDGNTASWTSSGLLPTWNLVPDDTYTVKATATDRAANAFPGSAITFTFDSTAPNVTVNQAGGQADPTATPTITFDAVFSESVTGVGAGDFTVGGSATGFSVTGISGSGSNYTVTVSGASVTDGTVTLSMLAGGASDAAGNANSASTSADNSVTYDATAPTITVNGVADGTYYKTAITPTYSATDASSVTVTATVDGADFTSGSTVSSEGPHTLVVHAVDAAGNESTTTVGFTIDATMPVISINGVADGMTYIMPVTPVFSATDDNLASVVATLDTGAFTSGTTVSGEGVHHLLVEATDRAGNVVTKSVTFTIDTVAPTTMLSAVPATPDGLDGWYKTSPSVTLAADKPGLTFYSQVAPTGPWTTYVAPFSIPEGTSTLWYFSVSSLGNTETVLSQAFKVDTTPPSINLAGVANATYYKAPVTPTFSASDANSVIVTATLDGADFTSGTTVSAEDTHTLVVHATDAAGNANTTSVTFTIDTVKPVITLGGVTGGAYYKASVAPTFSATDDHLASVVATLDGAAFTSGTPVSAEGTHTLLVEATDLAGNVVTDSVTFTIDTTPPLVSVAGVGNGSIYTAAVAPTFSATDDHLDALSATLDSVTFTSGTPVSAEGSHTLVVNATDLAGNSSTTTVGFAIDTLGPAITITGVIQDGLYAGSVTPTFSASDPHLWAVSATLDGAAFNSGDTVSTEGSHTLVVGALDTAGNSSISTVEFAIDTLPPAINYSGVADKTVYTAAVTPTFSATDPHLFDVTATLDGVAFTSGSPVSVEGSHTLVIAASDLAGNVATETLTFAIDTLAPVITVGGVADGSVYAAAVNPTFSATDPHLWDVTATLDGVAFTSGDPVAAQGSHTLVVTAGDTVGNNTAKTVNFRIDTQGAGVAWAYPSADATAVGGVASVTLSGTATDADSGVGSVFVAIQRDSDSAWWDGATWGSTLTTLPAVGTTDWTYEWSFEPPSQDGEQTYTLLARAVDTLGSLGTTATRTAITIDNVGPTIVSAAAPDSTHVDVVFSESLAPTSSLAAAFTLDNSLSVIGATLDGDGRTVHIETSAQTGGVTYEVTAVLGALSDLAGNPSIAPNTATFSTGVPTIVTVAQGGDIGRPVALYYGARNTSNVVDEIVLSATGGPATVNTVKVTGLDTADSLNADISNVALYLDNGNHTFGAGDALLGAPASFSADASGSVAVFTSLGLDIPADASASVWIVYEVASGATEGHMVGSRVLSGDVEIASGMVAAFAPITSADDGLTLGFDFTPPTTTATGIPSGWTTDTVSVTLAANDAVSGVTQTLYRVGSGDTTAWVAVPFEVSAEGTTAVSYWSVDAAANTEAENSDNVRIDRSAPSVPGTPGVDAVGSDSVETSWTAATDTVSGVDFYEVLVNHAVATTSTATSATITSLAQETSYTITIVAVDFAGNRSAESSETTIATLGDRPRPPAAVYARSVGARGVFVDWGESTGTVPPVSYRVWRSVGGGSFSVIGSVGEGELRSYLDSSAPLFEALEYRVSVTDARGSGSASAPTALTSTIGTSLPAPVNVRATNTNSVLVTWTPSPLPNVAGYHVYRSSTSTGTPETQTVTPVVTASYHDTSTAEYSEYWYRVATVDTSGNVGAPSRPVYIRTEASGTVEPPHGSYTTDTDMCALCHAVHSSPSDQPLQPTLSVPATRTATALLRGTTTIDAPLCLSCHDGTSASNVLSEYVDGDRTSRHKVPVAGFDGGLVCASCHGVHSAITTDTPKLLLAKGETGGNAYCYSCHGAGANASVPGGDLRDFDDSAHGTNLGVPQSGTKVVCSTCHVSHTSREAELYPYTADDRCLSCHSLGGTSSAAGDISARLSGSGPDTRHDLLASDTEVTGARLACGNCHEPHSVTAAKPVVDPYDPAPNKTTVFDGTDYCLTCHDGGTLPTSADTSGWATAPLGESGETSLTDIATPWDQDSVHNKKVDAVSPNLRPEMGYVAGDDLVCTSCHDPHGSPNRYTLLDSVASKGATSTADGLLVVPMAGGGADLRFFCASCHNISALTHPGEGAGGADLSAFPLDCTKSGCHTHTGTGL